MSGKFLLIGIILQLARAVRVAGGDCESGKFPVANPDSSNTCAPCNDSNKGGIGHCMECSVLPPKARSSAVFIKCTKCSTNTLSPLGDACLADCPYGSYETTTTPDNTRVCIPCHPSCARCNNNAGAAFCTSCYPGFVLSHPNGPFGTCIPECTEEFSANCETGYCTADIVGSKYCSKCKSGFAPMNGVCVLAETTRVASDGCPSKGDGVCASCTSTYLLQSGGCYNTQTFPARLICTTTDNNGKCTTCANSLNPDGNGVCPACPAGCSKCSSSSPSQQCSECLAGYYLSGTKCVKCSENSTNGSNTITGVPNCVSCAPPSGSGTVTCYVTQEPSVNPADPSVNKGGLSSGAIAGISVIAVLVVGALISFICWWFLCKTKHGGVSSSTTSSRSLHSGADDKR